MTTNNIPPSAAPVSATRIDNVDTFAVRLYRRARNAGADFADVAAIVRSVHTVLKHLKVEAEDPGSLLNTGQSPVYVRQLTPIVEDCEFTLRQLDTILEKYGANSSGSEGDDHYRPSEERRLGARERDMIALVRTKLENQKLNIDMFLDTVQLHNPAKSHRVVDTSNANLEPIKDQVDAIASRIIQRRDSSLGEDEDELWLQFRNELERAGFSKDVLRKHQDVLRAYIRQLDEQSVLSGGKTPTVRGFLEGYTPGSDAQNSVPYPLDSEDGYSPREMLSTANNEKFAPSMKTERLHPDPYHPYPSGLPKDATNLSYDANSSEDGESTDNTMALVISTRDLMALDQRQADLAIAMDNMHLQLPPPGYPPNFVQDPALSASPQSRFLEAPPNGGLLASPPALPSLDEYGLSPRFVPAYPPPPYGSSPPPTLRSNSLSAPAIPGSAALVHGAQDQPQRYARLAPDSQGREIPLDAKWTRVKRQLISPVVLNEAGVRYEARPDFVAILGVFTKDDIAEFARRSAEVRKSRQRVNQRGTRQGQQDRYYPDKYKNWDVEGQNKDEEGQGRHRANSEYSASSTDLFDSSDEESEDDAPHRRTRGLQNGFQGSPDKYNHEEKGTKVYPFIVSPPEKEKENGHSPSATVMPKPILKNKNDDPHVRFDPEPKVLDISSPRSVPRHSGRSERRHRGGSDRDRHAPRSYDDRNDRLRDREREKQRDRDRDDDPKRHHRHHDSSRRRDRDQDDYSRRHRRDDSYRDRDRYRDDTDRSEDRSIKKRVRSETLRAVGIGGAAASLLGVLAEAASGF